MFKRRQPRSYLMQAREMVYPTGGFKRAIQYMLHRMRRLPDEPHRIARGVFAGTFVNFPPIFGFQFLSAALFAWVLRGNILAALLATFLSNPITTPLIAVGSLELGHWMLGIREPMDFLDIVRHFSDAGGEIWHNIRAIFTHDVARWEHLRDFFRLIYWPYFIGSLIPGLIVSVAAYYLTLPLVQAYQKLRARKTKERVEALRRQRAAEAAVVAAHMVGVAEPAGQAASAAGDAAGDPSDDAGGDDMGRAD